MKVQDFIENGGPQPETVQIMSFNSGKINSIRMSKDFSIFLTGGDDGYL